MEIVKKGKEHSIWKKRSGRHAVTDGKGAFVHGDEKIKILLAEGIAKKPAAKKPKADAAEKPSA